MNKILLFIFLLFTCGKCLSQNLFRTLNGHVLIYGEFNDSTFIAESHKLEFHYDNKSKVIVGKIFPNSFISGIPFLDSILSEKSGSAILIQGYIPIDFLTWEHKEYKLNVPLEFKFNSIATKSLSQIKFTHANNLAAYTCVMEATFILDLKDLNIEVPEKLNSKINVQFLQLILRRENQ